MCGGFGLGGESELVDVVDPANGDEAFGCGGWCIMPVDGAVG